MSDQTAPKRADSGAISELIRASLPNLSTSLARVAHAVLDDPLAVAQLSAEQLAMRANASQASVTRFCKAIGLSSYQDLIWRIAQESGRSDGPMWGGAELDGNIDPSDSLEQVVSIVASSDVRGITQSAERMDLASVERAAQAISKARLIDVYGIGGSGAVARETETRLFRIGFPVRAWTEVHAARTSAALLTPRDVAIGISDSGYTAETIEALRQAKERGAATVALTRDRRSPLGKLADIQLTASGLDTTFRVGPIASRHAQLLLIDVIYVRVAQLNYERAAASLSLTAHIAAEHSVPRRHAGA